MFAKQETGSFYSFPNIFLLWHIVVKVIIYPHRKRINAHYATVYPGFIQTEIHMEYPFGRADEMTHIVMCMKCDKIGS